MFGKPFVNACGNALAAFLLCLQARRCSPCTLRSYQNCLHAFLEFLQSHDVDTPLDITQELIAQYLVFRRSVCQNSRGTLCVHWYALHRFCLYLLQIGLIPQDPCQLFRPTVVPRRIPRCVLTRRQVRKILHHIDRPHPMSVRDSALLELFYATGIRCAEMTQLCLQDINWEQALVHVVAGKFARDRLVPMGAMALEQLQKYLPVRERWLANQSPQSALWLSALPPHQPLQTPGIATIVRKLARQAKIRPTVGPHVWRHTCATHLIRAGAPLTHVQQLLGHRSLNTTQIYLRVTIGDLQRSHRRCHPWANERIPHDHNQHAG